MCVLEYGPGRSTPGQHEFTANMIRLALQRHAYHKIREWLLGIEPRFHWQFSPYLAVWALAFYIELQPY